MLLFSRHLVYYRFITIVLQRVEVSKFYSLIAVKINPLNTKRRLLYLKTQFVPRSKHFSPRL